MASTSCIQSPPAMPLCLLIVTLLASLLQSATAQTLPYVPTSIFVPEKNIVPLQQNVSADIAYVFATSGDTVELFTLDVSKSIDASSVFLDPISTSLPFLGDSNTAFTPSLSDNGSLIVYAGDCSSADRTSVWTWDPSTHGDTPVWTQIKTATASGNDATKMGPGFLGGGFSFSTTLQPVMTRASLYVYGGMCPNASSNATTAQSKASYSNKMVRLSPSKSDTNGYDIALVKNQGPPIAEAGFTFTGLSSSISNRSGTVTQQVNYVLLGGHTQSAFVNMSTVAIWSLPEESWTYPSNIGIASSSTGSTELRDTATSIDSRSGHTAVLSEDGATLVILGGWVGELAQAAEPQLAILHLGAGYGGLGEWQWSIPTKQPPGYGMYGHGAALLPGNVMIVYGGYQIPAPAGSKIKRQSAGSTKPMFLNLTSLEWADDYTNPNYSSESAGQSGSSSSTDESKRNLGLGLGLGLGLAAILAALLIYLWYRRRLRHRRTIRNSTLQALAQDQTRYVHDVDGGMIERPAFTWYGAGQQTERRSLGYESLRRGSTDVNREALWDDDEDTDPQFRRKPVAPRSARGQYQPAPTTNFEPPPPALGPRSIHPIYEADEDGSMHDADVANEKMDPSHDFRGDNDDPFVTPTAERTWSLPPPAHANRTPSPERSQSMTDPDVQDWMIDVDTADALLSGRLAPRAVAAGTGRTSPTRRGTVRSNRSIGQYFGGDDDSRTGSNLSDSARSNLSGNSGSIRLRPSPGFGVAAAATTAAATEGRLGTAGSGTTSSSVSTPSYNTARTSFHALQTEGPSLLHGNNRNPEIEEPGSPSKSKPRRGWLGSLRRVFSGSGGGHTVRGSDYIESPTDDIFGDSNDYDPRVGGLSEIAAGGLLKRKGGRGAWAGEGSSSLAGPSSGGYQQTRNQDSDEDWDIEKEVEKRLVQVMFTVPKERLRVVNAEPDFDGESAVFVDPSDGDASGSNSHSSSNDSAQQQQREKGKEVAGRALTPTLMAPPTPPRTTSPYERGMLSMPGPLVMTPEPETSEHRTFSFGGETMSVRSPSGKVIKTGAAPMDKKVADESVGGSRKGERRFSFQPNEVLNVSHASTETPIAVEGRQKGKGTGAISSDEDDDEGAGGVSLALEREIELLGKELENQRSRSSGRPISAISSGMMSDDNLSVGDVYSAEAVHIARPQAKTRVLQMVESFESLKRDREPSPVPSPSPSRTPSK